MKNVAFPAKNEFAAFYDTYLDKVDTQLKVLDELKRSGKELIELYKGLTPDQLTTPYAEGKWSLKDVMMHLLDVERVFLYRAMRFARQDQTPLPFFDENEYARQANADKIPTRKLLKEYRTSRAATLSFFDNLTAAQFHFKGVASQCNMSVRACVWVIYAHERHHLAVIREHYLKL